jgi:hypothetical protein
MSVEKVTQLRNRALVIAEQRAFGLMVHGAVHDVTSKVQCPQVSPSQHYESRQRSKACWRNGLTLMAEAIAEFLPGNIIGPLLDSSQESGYLLRRPEDVVQLLPVHHVGIQHHVSTPTLPESRTSTRHFLFREACVRCSLLRPDPAQRPRLEEIRDNLIARIAEAERDGWLGEVEGLRVSLAGAEDKLAQLNARHERSSPTVFLGTPSSDQIRVRDVDASDPADHQQ